jgi:hypothetical protein
MIDWNIDEARRCLVAYIVLRYYQIYGGLRGKFQLHKTLLRTKAHSEDLDLKVFDSIDFTRKRFPFFAEGMATELDILKRQGKVIYKRKGPLRFEIAERFLPYFYRMKERLEDLISLRGDDQDFSLFKLIDRAIFELGTMTLEEIEEEFEDEAKAIPREMELGEFKKTSEDKKEVQNE